MLLLATRGMTRATRLPVHLLRFARYMYTYTCENYNSPTLTRVRSQLRSIGQLPSSERAVGYRGTCTSLIRNRPPP